MTYLKDKVLIYRGKHRLVDRMMTLIYSVACTTLAARVVLQGGATPFAPNTRAELESRLFPIDVWLPMTGVVEMALHSQSPAFIAVIFAPQSMRVLPEPRGTTTTHGQSVHWVKGSLTPPMFNIISPLFVEFFESHRHWIEQKFGKNPKKWLPIFDFARVIRNAMSHGGKLRITNPTAKAQWYNLKYSIENNGRNILLDFGMGDFVVLMFEIADELDKQGCPLDPATKSNRRAALSLFTPFP
jgi:hypothetical protein